MDVNSIIAEFENLQVKLQDENVQKNKIIDTFGWNIEYIDEQALLVFIDTLIMRGINDFSTKKANPRIIDCGANIGLSVLNYKRLYPNSKIIAFEPDPIFFPILSRNLEMNNCNDVEIIKAAVWVNNSKSPWYCEGIDGSQLVDNSKENNENVVKVDTIDLADYLNQDIDLLKIDIEGAEFTVIPHISNKLNFVNNIVIECHLTQEKMNAFANIIGVLSSAGFKLGINSYGAWVDLIRRQNPAPNQYEQYILVAGWRDPLPKDFSSNTITPNLPIPKPSNNQKVNKLDRLANRLRSLLSFILSIF